LSESRELVKAAQAERVNALAVAPICNPDALLAYIEHDYTSYGTVPKPEDCAHILRCTVESVQKTLATASFRKRLENRGIPSGPADFLTQEQVACVNVLLDFSDPRTQNQKLRALGITSQQFMGWSANKQFSAYYRRRSENLLDEVGVATGHTALLKQTEKGNVQAIKLMYEITGRTTSSENLNVEYFLQRVIEVIQIHVKQPEILGAIAQDFAKLLGETNVSKEN